MTDEIVAETAVEQVAVDAKNEAENETHSKLAEIYTAFKEKLAEIDASVKSVTTDAETKVKEVESWLLAEIKSL